MCQRDCLTAWIRPSNGSKQCGQNTTKEPVMPENLPENARKVGSPPHHDLFVADADDILIVVPEVGFKDTQEASRTTVAALLEYGRNLGRKCGLVIIANNLLAQEAESRRIYAENVV